MLGLNQKNKLEIYGAIGVSEVQKPASPETYSKLSNDIVRKRHVVYRLGKQTSKSWKYGCDSVDSAVLREMV